MPQKSFVLWFSQLGIKDVPLVGGKNASLGEMYRKLTPQGINIPDGFAVTAEAYFYLLKKTEIEKKIKTILNSLNIKSLASLSSVGSQIRTLILNANFPKELEQEIIKFYHELSRKYKTQNVDVAVRSSATAEDLPDASFAGQQETYLNIRGEKALLAACHRCFASLFTNRAISYREDKHFDHLKIGLSIGIQKMVRSDKGSSGVMFSIDTESGFPDLVLINGVWGLGENIVQGAINPDEFYVFKPLLAKGFKSILSRKMGDKKIKMIYTTDPAQPTKNIATTSTERNNFCLNDKKILQLARWAMAIEAHYKKPMDLEWAKDGISGKLYIVQARPETVQSQKNYNVLEEYQLLEKGKPILSGAAVGSKIGIGRARIIEDVKKIHEFKKDEVLATDMTNPDWEPIMKIASAIVTNKGGRTCHAAIVSRELGIPCIVGTGQATQLLKNNQEITVSCAEGEKGYVYKKTLKFRVKKTNLKNFRRPKTKIMMNIGSPDIAFSSSFIPNDGVGLAREEFIINEHIKVHPLALLNFAKIKDKKVKEEISQITRGYKNKKQFFIDKLAEGVAIIGAAFYPKDVIVRLSDFKSNEYANLIGGRIYEPQEENPMIGWRGASRYYSQLFRPAFDLECQALRKVREVMGLKNTKIMVPFCRTIEEGKKTIKIMAENGLKRGKDNLKIYVMCEIPSNVILAPEFAKIFDGFSIGSNDLTQLALGVDRDSTLVSHIYDERNAAVKNLIRTVIERAKASKRKIGICGQAPSDFPDFAQFLVECGIDSISLNPDTVIKTTIDILKKEAQLKKSKKFKNG
jgi:pyruvate,water dikinase